MVDIVKKLIFLSILLMTQVSFADDDINCSTVNYHNSAKDWAISNACHYKNVVLMQIERGKVKNWYNPFRFFNKTNTYRYPAKVLEVYKSNNIKVNNVVCLELPLEDSKLYSEGLMGKRIIAFDNVGDCAYLETGEFPEANSLLIYYTKKIIQEYK